MAPCIEYIHADHAFRCRGCMDVVEIPQGVNDGESTLAAKEELEIVHTARGCPALAHNLDMAQAEIIADAIRHHGLSLVR